MEKIDARILSTETQQQLRNQVVRLREAGKKLKEVSEITGVSVKTICKWHKTYLEGGKSAIQIKKRDRTLGCFRTLTQDQEKELQKFMRDKCPDQLKFPFALWTRKAVKPAIKEFYDIEMPIRTVGEYLKRCGFTPQRPLKKAYSQNPKAVKAWLTEDYPKITSKAKKENAEIHWGYETGLCNDSYYGRSYAPRGETPEIKVHSRCKRVNLISSVTNQGKVRFMVYKDMINSQTLQ